MRSQTAQSRILVVLATVILGTAGASRAETAAAPATAPATATWRGFTVDASIWGAAGDTDFRIDDNGGPVVSKLEYPMRGAMAEVRGSYALPILHQRLALRARYAHSLVVQGTSKDTDYYPDGSTWNYSESDSEATVQQWDFDLVYLHTFKKILSIGAFVGYGSEESDFSDTDLVNKIPDYYTIDGDVSSYDVTFSGFRVGPMARWQIIKRLSVEGELAVMPYVSAKADADWKLRDYPFHQEANGIGLNGRVRVAYTFTQHLGAFIGVRGTWLNANRDGKESGNDAGATYSDEPIVKDITSQYFGFEGGVRGMF